MPVRGPANYSQHNPSPEPKNTGHKPVHMELASLGEFSFGSIETEAKPLETRKVKLVKIYLGTDLKVKNATEGVLSRSSSSLSDSPFSSPSASPRIDGDFKVPLYEAILKNASFTLNDWDRDYVFNEILQKPAEKTNAELLSKHNDAMEALKDSSVQPKDRYKAYVIHLRDVLQSESIDPGVADRYVGYAYNELVTCGNVREPIEEALDRLGVRIDAMDVQSDLPYEGDVDERTSGIGDEVLGSPSTSPTRSLSSRNISDLTGAAEESQTSLRSGLGRRFHSLVTTVRRAANNIGEWDQISLGNIPYRLGTLTMGDTENSFQVEVLRHGSPLITSSFAGGFESSVTPEFKAWVKTFPTDTESERTPLLYINRMKRNSGDEIARSAALRNFADSVEGKKMTMLTLPADGKYYTQEKDYEGDKDFSALCEELVSRMVSREDDSEFDIPDNVRQKLVANWQNEKRLELSYSDDDFSSMIRNRFTEESENYFLEGEGRPLKDRPLNREERRALLINFINGRFVDEVLKATQPFQYINSCKENVDRGAVGNAITAYRNGSSDSDTVSMLFGAAAVSKRRVINSNVENFVLWLKFRKPLGGQGSPENFRLYHPPERKDPPEGKDPLERG